MVEDVGDVKKKKLVLPRATGPRSRSVLNVGARASGVDNVGGKRAVRTMFIVLGLRALGNLNQQPLALANLDQQIFLPPSSSVRKPRSDAKITNCILGELEFAGIVASIAVLGSSGGCWSIQMV
ncbi:hypothetical protein Tco_1053597 [Tanacetum coccineum]|uniref:Uncharacterized protein n=1 Tax=Tanacetum coccineum TaxID=301880 RepID=A0ABQ5GV50_9ASTR